MRLRLRARASASARAHVRTGLRLRQPRGAAAAKGVGDLVSSRQVSQHGLERLGRARRVCLLVPPELACVAAYFDGHIHPIVGEQRRLKRAPQRGDELGE